MANASTVNGAIPKQGARLLSQPIRDNFAAAKSDINNIYNILANANIGNSVTTLVNVASYNVVATDKIIIVNNTAPMAVQINIQPGSNGRELTVIDGSPGAYANNITVAAVSGQINKASTFVMNIDGMAIGVVDDGTNLWVK